MAKTSGQDASKKTIQKKKQQAIEDKTFGLKNKNKSKKVQQQVKSIEKNVMNSGDPKLRKLEEERKKAKEAAKERKKLAEQEQNALFGEALLAVKSKKTLDQKSGKLEAVGRDAANDESKKSGTSRAMKMMFQMDAQEMSEKLKEDVRSLCFLRVTLAEDGADVDFRDSNRLRKQLCIPSLVMQQTCFLCLTVTHGLP
jgi:hypothetical protein